MRLHPKILELRKTMGATPFWTPPIDAVVEQPEELRKANMQTDTRLIKAYHNIWGEIDDRGTRWIKGAFKRSIQDRGPKSNAKYKITVLYMHDVRDPIALPSVLEERDKGLYAEYEPDDVPSGNRTVTQIRSGTINNFSFGFIPIWDKMEYNSDDECIDVYEAELLEISPVTMGSNMNTYALRGKNGIYEDKYLIEETEEFISTIPRKQQLELRQLIDRHIALERSRKKLASEIRSLEKGSNSNDIDYGYLLKHLKH